MENSSIAMMKVNTPKGIASKLKLHFQSIGRSQHKQSFYFFFLEFKRGSYFVFKSGEVLPTAEKRVWDIQSFHYNNVAAAMLTLFAVQTTEGWPT